MICHNNIGFGLALSGSELFKGPDMLLLDFHAVCMYSHSLVKIKGISFSKKTLTFFGNPKKRCKRLSRYIHIHIYILYYYILTYNYNNQTLSLIKSNSQTPKSLTFQAKKHLPSILGREISLCREVQM